MNKESWYTICPFCVQGRLFIYIDQAQRQPYLHCEECERGYRNPELLNVENSFLTITSDIVCSPATDSEIKEFGWDKYALHTV
jgi:hypothetical protein